MEHSAEIDSFKIKKGTLKDFYNSKNPEINIKMLRQLIFQLLWIYFILKSSGICHNDIKPDNILLFKTEEKIIEYEVDENLIFYLNPDIQYNVEPKIIDFGESTYEDCDEMSWILFCIIKLVAKYNKNKKNKKYDEEIENLLNQITKKDDMLNIFNNKFFEQLKHLPKK
jgi:serine/threonine protein kinase